MAQSPETVAEWLKSLPNTRVLWCGYLRIGRTTHVAVLYERDLEAPQGSQNPGPFTATQYYVPGALPASYLGNGRKTVYRLPGDDRDWYVGSYYQPIPSVREWAASNPEIAAKFHPFGSSWTLHVWEVPNGERIDRWDRAGTPRRRMNITKIG